MKTRHLRQFALLLATAVSLGDGAVQAQPAADKKFEIVEATIADIH